MMSQNIKYSISLYDLETRECVQPYDLICMLSSAIIPLEQSFNCWSENRTN